MSEALDNLREQLLTVHQPPYLPLYLHDADVELLGPELARGNRPGTWLWQGLVWLAPCDHDGFTWVAYRRQLSPGRRGMRQACEGKLTRGNLGSKRWERRRVKIEARRVAQGRPPSLAERARIRAKKKRESAGAVP